MLLTSESMKKLGRLAGVDALVAGTVEAYKVDEWRERIYARRTGEVSANIKAVSITTGRVVWSKRSTGTHSVLGSAGRIHAMGSQTFLDEAFKSVAADARSLFPHKEKVKVPASEAAEAGE